MNLLARLIPAADREAILGDLAEEAAFRDLSGTRRAMWLTGECAAIAAGLSVERVRGWLIVPGIALEGRGVLRDGAAATLLPALLFLGSVAMLVAGVAVLVSVLMSAAGF
jgi:hypothetical protein